MQVAILITGDDLEDKTKMIPPNVAYSVEDYALGDDAPMLKLTVYFTDDATAKAWIKNIG